METLDKELNNLSNEIQCRVGEGGISFGNAQKQTMGLCRWCRHHKFLTKFK